MRSWLGGCFRRHPLLRDALVWVIPALVFGAVLRLLLMSYSPYAYWGSDSRSYFGFANGVISEFYFSLNEKRRYLYPIFLLPISLLPGGVLRWLPWIQMLLGLAALVPLAYTVRRIFRQWKWWIVPITLIYAGMPIMIWYEHELLADSIFFDCAVWMLGGWAAWISQRNLDRARQLFWWFFVPFAIFVLTKPSAKFYWPGILLALVIVAAWRTLKWKEWVAIAALFGAGLTVGDPDQGAWLLYTSSFPLTRMDTPLHAEYKQEIRDLVELKRARIDSYDEEDMDVHNFLRSPEDHPERPKWQALAKDKAKMERIYKDIAMEGIKSRPDLFLYIALLRLAGSCNPADFEEKHFQATYFADKFDDAYTQKRNSQPMIRNAFWISRDAPFPTLEEFRRWVSPKPDSAAAAWLVNYARNYQQAGELVKRPSGKGKSLLNYRLTALGWWLLLGIIASLIPPYLRPLGVWSIIVGSNVVAVYMVGIEHVRYFAPVWPVLVVLLAVVPDIVVTRIRAMRK